MQSNHETSQNAAGDARRRANVDESEVERFARLADAWWDPHGKFRPLHKIGPARIEFACAHVAEVHGRDRDQLKPFEGLDVLDIGCGGGLMCEPFARLGANVTGIDPAGSGIEAAKIHAERGGLDIAYESVTAEELAARGQRFDVVLCLEVIEHVPDVAELVRVCGQLAKPGGALCFSTINRTLKAFALAIVGAEYVLRWLPRGTHTYDKLVTPDELRAAIRAAGCDLGKENGLTFNPLFDRWSLSSDLSVNYLMAATKRINSGSDFR